jgi:hypothetical protein
MYFAHPGHWLVDAAYFLPVVAFLAWLLVTQIRERRRSRSGAYTHRRYPHHSPSGRSSDG